MNLILQAIEALICFNFYESINNTDKKLINAVTIQVGYLIMAGINILFNYNVIINTAMLLIFQLLFARILYKMKAVFSLLYSLLFTVGVTITEISVINVLAVMFDTHSKAFISNPYSYIVLIVASKSLLFVLLRVVVAVVRKTDYKEAIKWHLLIYPASLLLVLTVFVIISYEVNLDDSFKILIAVSSLVLIVSVVFTSIYQQKTSEKEAELIELRTIQSERQINTHTTSCLHTKMTNCKCLFMIQKSTITTFIQWQATIKKLKTISTALLMILTIQTTSAKHQTNCLI